MASFFGFSYPPSPENEPVYDYAPGTAERDHLQQKLSDLRKETHDIPMYIGGKEVRTHKKIPIHAPHDHAHLLGYLHEGDGKHVKEAIQASLEARTRLVKYGLAGKSGHLFTCC